MSLTDQRLGDGEKTFTRNAFFRTLFGVKWFDNDNVTEGAFAWLPQDGSSRNFWQLIVFVVGGQQAQATIELRATLTQVFFRVVETSLANGDVFYSVQDISGIYNGATGTFANSTVVGGIVTGSAGTLTVSQGGTGATSFTTNGVLYGNGTSALQVTAVGVNRKFLAAHTGTAPTFEFLPEASFSSEGIITFNSPPDFTNGQVLGNGLKMADQFAVGTLTGPLTANNLFECNGESLFFDPLRIAADSAIPGIIEAYDAGNTGMKIEFVPRATTLDVFRTIIRSGSNTFKAQMNADGTDGNDTFDLVHSSTNTPRFAVGGTKGNTQSDVAVATVKGGIITAAEATGSSFLSRNFLGI